MIFRVNTESFLILISVWVLFNHCFITGEESQVAWLPWQSRARCFRVVIKISPFKCNRLYLLLRLHAFYFSINMFVMLSHSFNLFYTWHDCLWKYLLWSLIFVRVLFLYQTYIIKAKVCMFMCNLGIPVSRISHGIRLYVGKTALWQWINFNFMWQVNYNMLVLVGGRPLCKAHLRRHHSHTD